MNRTSLVALLAAVFSSACDAAPAASTPPPPSAPAATTPAQVVSAAPKPAAAPGESVLLGVRYLERITGGASASDRLPMIVAMHGLGDNPRSFFAVYSGASFKARWIIPAGFNAWGDGFSWFSLDGSHDPKIFADVTSAAADRLSGFIQELAQKVPTSGKAIVTGFSQGGMLSFTLAVRHPELVSDAFPLGGRLAEALVPSEWPVGQPKPRVHAFHGAIDPRVPTERARVAVKQLKGLGLDAEITEYPGVGHTISPDERLDVLKELERAASPH